MTTVIDAGSHDAAPSRAAVAPQRRAGRTRTGRVGIVLSLVAAMFAATHMQDVANIAALVALGLVVVAGIGRLGIPSRIPVEIVLFVVLGVYLFAVSLANDALANLTLVEFIVRHGKYYYIVGLFVVFYLFKPGCAIERVTYRGAIFFSVILSAASLYSYFVSPIQFSEFKLSNSNSIQGLFGGKNPMAGCMGAILLLLLLSVFNGDSRIATHYRQLLIGLAATFVAAAFLFAKSRGYALGLLAAIGWLAIRTILQDWSNYHLSSRTVAYGLGCVGFIVAILAFGGDRYENAFENDPNVETRFELWERALRMFFMSPIFGLGLGTFQAVNTTFETVIPGLLSFKTGGVYLPGHIEHDPEGGLHTHNVYLQLLVDGGIIGASLFLVTLALLVRRAIVVSRVLSGRDEEICVLARFNAAVVIVMFVYLAMAGVTAGFTFTSPTMSWIFFVAAARLARQHQYLARTEGWASVTGAIGRAAVSGGGRP